MNTPISDLVDTMLDLEVTRTQATNALLSLLKKSHALPHGNRQHVTALIAKAAHAISCMSPYLREEDAPLPLEPVDTRVYIVFGHGHGQTITVEHKGSPHRGPVQRELLRYRSPVGGWAYAVEVADGNTWGTDTETGEIRYLAIENG